MGWDFGGRVALVTGAAGMGIGQAIARRLASDNATVIVTDSHERRTQEVAQKIAGEYDTRVVGYTLDVGDRDRCDEVIAEVSQKYGPIQILVNNACLNIMGDIFEYDADDFDRCLNIDLVAPWYLAKSVAPGMKEAGGGSIVNISSVAADGGAAASEPPYAISKGGMHTLTRGLATAGGPFKIRCNAITMGVVRGTKFIEVHHRDMIKGAEQRVPMRRLATTEDIANTVAFLCSDDAAYISGEIVNVNGAASMRA